MQINGIYFNGISTPIMVQNPKSRQFTTQNNDNQDVFVKSNTQPGTIVSTEKSLAPTFGCKRLSIYVPKEVAARAKELGIRRFRFTDRIYCDSGLSNDKKILDEGRKPGWFVSTTSSIRGEYYFANYGDDRQLKRVIVITKNDNGISHYKLSV